MSKNSDFEKLKFELYIDAIGDGAARSRGIIGLLMTISLVAGLGLFNSLRTEHNWFSSRIEALHKVHNWLVFPDDYRSPTNIILPKDYLDKEFAFDSIVVTKNASIESILDTVGVERSNVFYWNEYRQILRNFITVSSLDTSILPTIMPVQLRFKFPEYCINPDRTLNASQILNSDLNQILLALESMHTVSRAEINTLLNHYSRARIEHTILIKMPILGVSFDVNWLGLVSSVSFFIIIFLLYYSLSRERKNLFLVFKVAEEKKVDRVDFYQLLSMRQVLNVPAGIDQIFNGIIERERTPFAKGIRRFTSRLGMFTIFIPVLVWVLIVLHDISTFKIGLSVNRLLTIVSFSLSIFMGLLMSFFAFLCWSEWEKIRKIWKEEAVKIENESKKEEV